MPEKSAHTRSPRIEPEACARVAQAMHSKQRNGVRRDGQVQARTPGGPKMVPFQCVSVISS